MAQAAGEDMAAARDYAARKAAFQNTAEACAAEEVLFAPMVAERTGTWEPSADPALPRISRAVVARDGTDPATAWKLSHQRLCVLLRRARARAELRDRGPRGYRNPADPRTVVLRLSGR